MEILRFSEFISESYLSGSRQPMYHKMGLYSLDTVLKSDTFKRKAPVKPKNGILSNSWTRSIYYGYMDIISIGVILEVDADKLRNDGVRFYPVDEWALSSKKSTRDNHYGKSNFDKVKSGKRGTLHNLKLSKTAILETEFEERTYKDIKNLGKYIISIGIQSNLIQTIPKSTILTLQNYLQKYDHIKIYSFENKNPRNRTDVTDKFTSVEKKVFSMS